MKRLSKFFVMVPMVLILVLSACGNAPATKAVSTQSVVYVPTEVPAIPEATATPEPTVIETLSTKDAAIEVAWMVQKPLIDAAVALVFTDKVTSPWLSPILNITTLTADTPAAHCQAMKLWDNFIPVPQSLKDCQASRTSIDDYFGITTMPLRTLKDDKLVMKIFFSRPIPSCDNSGCRFLPAPGSVDYGMVLGDYQVVTYCGTPTDVQPANSINQLWPYFKDPVSTIIKRGDTYVEIITNRGAWVALGWEKSGKGWDEVFPVCPSN